jgi:hypothetical protein
VGVLGDGMFRRLFHAYPLDLENHACWCAHRGVVVSGAGSEREKDDGRLRAIDWALCVRLRSIELVHRLHLHQWQIDAGAVLALLRTERSLSCTALLN